MTSQKIFNLIGRETARQKNGLIMIPSENYASPNVLKAMGMDIAFSMNADFTSINKDGGLYIGKTGNFKRRLYEHNAGKVQSTKARVPMALLKTFPCENEMEARMLTKIRDSLLPKLMSGKIRLS